MKNYRPKCKHNCGCKRKAYHGSTKQLCFSCWNGFCKLLNA